MTTEWSRVNTYISRCERHRRSPILSTRCSGLVERRNSSLTIIRKHRKGLRSGVSRLKRTMLRKIREKETHHRGANGSPLPSVTGRARSERAWKRTCAPTNSAKSRPGWGTPASACVYMLYIGSQLSYKRHRCPSQQTRLERLRASFRGFSTLGSSVSSRCRNSVCTAISLDLACRVLYRA